MTFGPECVPTKTKDSHFLNDIVLCAPSAKRQKVLKHSLWDFQTFIELTVAGNMYGELKNADFLVKLRQLIQVVMSLESHLFILPYTDCVSTTKY